MTRHRAPSPTRHLMNRAAFHFEDFAQDLRAAAQRLRGCLDPAPDRPLSGDILEGVGQLTYKLYQTGTEEVPRLLHRSLSRLDEAAEELKREPGVSSFVKNAGIHMRDVVRNAALDVNDVVERLVKNRGRDEGPGNP